MFTIRIRLYDERRYGLGGVARVLHRNTLKEVQRIYQGIKSSGMWCGQPASVDSDPSYTSVQGYSAESPNTSVSRFSLNV